MRWEIKMDFIIKEALNNNYVVLVVNDNEFNIYHLGILCMNVKTVSPLSAHWRGELKSAIIKIIDFKITDIYKKY